MKKNFCMAVLAKSRCFNFVSKFTMSCGFLAACMHVQGQAESRTNASAAVSERGLHHTVNEHVEVVERNGQQESITNRYTTLATGMHRMVNGELVEADPVIELHPDGAIADKTQHKVKFLANINNWEGGIDLEMNGQHFLSRPLGISYFDEASGNSILIAELKDSVGTLFPPNKVIYQSAFTDFKADLEYNNFLSGLQQNLIFRESPPEPASFGLNNDTTYIELLTEFFAAPEPLKKTEVRNGVEDDRQLDFGSMKMGVGKSFVIGEETPAYSVEKQWTQLEGRHFLIERVPYAKVAPLINTLPLPEVANNPKTDKIRHIASKKRLLPERQVAKLETAPQMQVASAPIEQTGFVIDYSLVTGSLTNYVFQADKTYFITNSVFLYGTTVLEGGTVIKYDGGSLLLDGGDLSCQTDTYRPAVFTSWEDDSVGEIIPGSSGNPGVEATCALILYTGSNTELKHLRISYASQAVEFNTSSTVSDCQIINCDWGLMSLGFDLWLRNNLFYQCTTALGIIEASIHGEHLTVNRSSDLVYEEFDMQVRLTNTLLVAVTNLGLTDINATNSNFIWFTNDPGIFQTIGAGSHYLVEASPYRNAGTTNINATLRANLRKRTSYPPIVLTNLASTVVLNPTAQRDTDVPDLGYLYPPLDFAISNGVATTITVTNGTVIAFYGDDDEGLISGTFVSEGSPLSPNRLVWYNTVQEQSTAWNSSTPGNMLSFDGQATVKCRFTDFSRLSSPVGYGYHFIDGTNGGMGGSFSFQDCSFNSGRFRFQSMTNAQSITANLSLTNCLFERVNATIQAIDNPISVYGFNNHFQWGSLTLSTQSFAGASGFTFRDNLLYRTEVTQGATVTNSHNAVWFALTNRFTPTNVADVVFEPLNEPQFTNGPLGDYYQVSSQCLNEGSRNADAAALYHFTTTTNQLKETNSVVDIGLHYVSIVNGLPADKDLDGLADYFEDTNGNGTHNTGELNWASADTDGDGVNDFFEWLQGANGNLGRNADGSINFQVFNVIK